MSSWISIPLLLGGGWVAMTMLGISIHPSRIEAINACDTSYPTKTPDGQRVNIFKYICSDQGAQIILMEDGKVIRRYFYL
jgi:hypothetical protein